MGSIEKEFKRAVGKGEKLGKKALGAQMTLYGIKPGSSGAGGDIAEQVSLGHMESGKTKQLRETEEKATAEQQAIVDEEKRLLDEEESKRKKRIARGRQGRRSLLYAGGERARGGTS